MKIIRLILLLMNISLSVQTPTEITYYKELQGLIFKKDKNKIQGLIKTPHQYWSKNIKIEVDKENILKIKSNEIKSIPMNNTGANESVYNLHKNEKFPYF